MAHLAGTPLPREGDYTVSLLCVVSTERCVTQVPEFAYDDRKGVGACDHGPDGLGSPFLARDAVSHERDVFT